MPKKKPRENRYRYSVIKYRKSLVGEPEDTPLAVVVETDGSFVLVGQEPELGDEQSLVAKQFIEQLPDVINKKVMDAASSGEQFSAVDILASSFSWNLFLSPVKEAVSDLDTLEFGYALFARHVSAGILELELPRPRLQGFVRHPQPFYALVPKDTDERALQPA